MSLILKAFVPDSIFARDSPFECNLEGSIHNLPPSPYPATAPCAQDETPRQGPKTPIQILHPAARTENCLSEAVAHRPGWSGKETPVSDTTQKYPLWQNHYLQAMAETRPELLKSKI